MTCAIDYAPIFQPRPPLVRRAAGAVRYAGVLAVWLGLLAIHPRLGWEIYRDRRPDSPLRRLAW